MLKNPDFDQQQWASLQSSLSLLCGFSIVIYDPQQKKPCAAERQQDSICALIHDVGKEMPCAESREEHVRLALSTQKILLFQCQAYLSYFVIPIVLSDQTQYAIIGGFSYVAQHDVMALRERAWKWGIAPKRLAGPISEHRVVSEDQLMTKAEHLQSVATLLIENIHFKNQYHAKSSYLSTLTHVANQLKNDPSPATHYATLLNSVGILFNLTRASVFQQHPGEETYVQIAGFGESKNKVSSDLFLNALLRKNKRPPSQSPCVTDPEDLLEAGFSSETKTLRLFPFSDQDGEQTVLAVINSALSEDETEMMASFCLQAGAALESLKLKSKIASQKKTIQSLSKLTLFDADLKETALYDTLLSQTTSLLEAEQGSLMVLDRKKKCLSVVAMTDVSPALYTLFNQKLGEGIAGHVCKNRSPLLVQNIVEDQRITRSPRPRYKTSSFVSVPLIQNEAPIGVISVADKVGGRQFSEEDLSLLNAMGSFLSMALERAQLRSKTEALKEISITDALTGLLNRRYFHYRLTEEIERTRRHGLPTCLLMIDVDNFKKVNDEHGHPVGDRVLQWVAQVIRNTIRTIDVASRYGGEEFTVILPNTSKNDARIIAERVCAVIEKRSGLQKKIPQMKNLTVSAGLASFPDDADSMQQLVSNSDQALYQAKHFGKNRVHVYRKKTEFN